MKTAFMVNDPRDLGAEQTTTLLLSAAVRRGHEVVVFGIADLSLDEDRCVRASGRVAIHDEPMALVRHLATADAAPITLDEQDLCVVRTNPGRDETRRSQHLAALRLLERLHDRNIVVLNRPRGLWRSLTKLSLLELPSALTPITLVTRDVLAIERFVAKHGRAVIKPLEGTRGQDVFVLEAATTGSNVRQIIDVVVRQGYAVVQEFVAGAERGDVRVTVVDGAILELDGQPAAVARVPNRGDFRSNLHAGGSAAPASVTDDMREAVARIAPLLANEGLAHVGVDFVGNRILELNVFSPGGLHPCQRLYGKDFSDVVFESFETRARAS